MSDLEIFGLTTAVVAIYAVIGGGTFALIDHTYKQDDPGPFFSGLFWPLVLPVLTGARIVGYILHREKKPKIPAAKIVSK